MFSFQAASALDPKYAVQGRYWAERNALVMELMRCSLYAERMETHPNPSLALILHWCLQCCSCVEHIHFKELLHRDIKPENFLVSEDGEHFCPPENKMEAVIW